MAKAKSRTLYRSKQDYVFAGVAGGLGEYFNTTPWLFRVLFFINPGLIIYLIMWALIPENPNQKTRAPRNSAAWIVLLIVLCIPLTVFFLVFANLILGFFASFIAALFAVKN